MKFETGPCTRRARLVSWGHCKTSRSLPPYTMILRVYCIEVLTLFSHIFSPDVFNNILLSQGCVFEMVPYAEPWWKVYSNNRGEVRSHLLPRLGSKVNCKSRPLDNLLQCVGYTLLQLSYISPYSNTSKQLLIVVSLISMGRYF